MRPRSSRIPAVTQHWGLPERIVTGVIYRHSPADGLDCVCDAVCVANLIARQIQSDNSEPIGVDRTVLERLSLAESQLSPLAAEARSQLEAISQHYNAAYDYFRSRATPSRRPDDDFLRHPLYPH